MNIQNSRNILKALFHGTTAFVACNELLEAEKKRKWWVRPMYQQRDEHGFYETTFQQMKDQDGEMFVKATRMSVSEFQTLLNLLHFRLQKNSYRKPISAECRLFLTLIYLAHGGPRYTYAFKFKMSTTTVGRIIVETCQAIWDELSSIYLSPPNSNDWLNIVNGYANKWNFPHCLGAIDGKHITIVCPPHGGSQYYNYKGRHSIVLLAICDANYCFSMVDVGAYGSQSDGGVLANTSFWKLLSQRRLPIPGPAPIGNSNQEFPYFFIGDSAFPLGKNLMRPFSGKNLSSEEDHFNRRLSHARVTIENTFGVMSTRWRILLNSIHAAPENVEGIVKAICVLHNYLMLKKCDSYCPPNYADTYADNGLQWGMWRNISDESPFHSMPSTRSHNSSREAYSLRKKLAAQLSNN